MRYLLIFPCIVFCAFLSAQPASDSLHALIERGMREWKVPGLAAVVVRDGEVVFQRAYGQRDVGADRPVTPRTRFALASTTKAFIAISIGMLVDEGKLEWTDKVRDHLPAFRLSDPYITETARVQDLLTHNLGLDDSAVEFLDTLGTTRELMTRFAHMPFAYPLRAGFIYTNEMYVVAGELIEAVDGRHWTRFVRERILQPLGMDRALTSAQDLPPTGDYATNYRIPTYGSPGRRAEARMNVAITGAAGDMYASIEDMGKYLQFLLAGGVGPTGDTLIKKQTLDYLFQPQTLIPEPQFYPTAKLTEPEWMSYGLGWFQHDYRGEKIDFHTGSLLGTVALAGLIRDRNLAVYVFANLDHAELRHAILYRALDLYAFDDRAGRDWHREVYDLYADLRQKAREKEEETQRDRITGTSPTFPLTTYAGDYTNAEYGTLTVSRRGDELHFDVNRSEGVSLGHWQHETWRGLHPYGFMTAYTFRIGADGKVAGVYDGDRYFERERVGE